MLDGFLKKIGLRQPEVDLESDPMAVMNLRVGQSVEIARSERWKVIGRVDYERNGHVWHNFRLARSGNEDQWLALEYWEEGPAVLLYTAVSLFTVPDAPASEQFFRTSAGAYPYELVEVGDARVSAVEGEVEVEVGAKLTYWQYARKEYDREFLAIEIWDGEKYASKGTLLSIHDVKVFR